jgi:ubiquitin C-terminal hydrolase
MRGFSNMGNTCYLNAGLQLLIQNEDMCSLIISYSHKSDVLKIIADFIKQYYDKNNNVLIPINIKKLVESSNKMFIGTNQHDSVEFVIYLLDIIDIEIKKIDNTKGIYSVFNTEINTRIKCKYINCLTIYNKKELNNFLLFNFEDDSKTLDDLYIQFKNSEILTDDNKYKCNNCNVKRVASKRQNIQVWGDNILVWLKRFSQTNMKIVKNNNCIDIPIIWKHDMILKGAIIHFGSVSSGHYVYIGYKDKWYLFDDMTVSEINDEQLNYYLKNAYLLYYKKISQ